MKDFLSGLLTLPSKDATRRAARTFLVAFAVLFIPGLLGWLHDLTAWAAASGATPFPDAHGLLWLAVSALTSAAIGLVNLLWLHVEDASGKALLRKPAGD